MNIEKSDTQDTAAFVTVLNVKPGDIIAAKLTRPMRTEDMIQLGQGLKRMFPGHTIGIIENGVDLVIVSGSSGEAEK